VKAYDCVPGKKLWGVLRENSIDADGRLLLTIKPLHSCSKVCVRVGGFKLQPFTLGV